MLSKVRRRQHFQYQFLLLEVVMYELCENYSDEEFNFIWNGHFFANLDAEIDLDDTERLQFCWYWICIVSCSVLDCWTNHLTHKGTWFSVFAVFCSMIPNTTVDILIIHIQINVNWLCCYRPRRRVLLWGSHHYCKDWLVEESCQRHISSFNDNDLIVTFLKRPLMVSL